MAEMQRNTKPFNRVRQLEIAVLPIHAAKTPHRKKHLRFDCSSVAACVANAGTF